MEEGNPDSNSTQKDILIPATRNEDDINPFEEYMWMGDPKEEDEVNQQVGSRSKVKCYVLQLDIMFLQDT